MIIINGEEWRILLVSPFHPLLQRTDGQFTLGACDDNFKTIYISNNLSEFKLKKVLCHEITHAVMFSYNICLTNEQEEIFADLIATYGQLIIDLADLVFNYINNEKGTYFL